MAKLSNFLDVIKPDWVRKPRQPWERVAVIDCTHEFGAGTSTMYVRKLARKLGIQTVRIDGKAYLTREDVEVMKDWHRHHGNKIR